MKANIYFGDASKKGGTPIMIVIGSKAACWFDSYYGRHKHSFQQRLRAVVAALNYAEIEVETCDKLHSILSES